MNILIIRFSSLGDLVTLSLILRSIRHFYPNHRITFLTSKIGKELYQDTDFFDDYIVHTDYLSSIKELRQQKFEIIFNLHCNSLSHILASLSKHNKNINASANIFQKILNIKIIVKAPEKTLIESGLDENNVMSYFQNEKFKNISLPCMDNYLIKSEKKIVVISTGSSEKWKSKQWGITRYKALVKKLLNDNFEIAIIGTKLELEDSNDILINFPKVINFVNNTNLTSLKQILKQANLYIGNDSGPSHIAAAVGTNTITIFGSTDIKHCVKFMPYNGTHICIRPNKNITCHPCYKGICPTKMECMESIKVDNVYNSAIKLLNEGNK